VRTVDPPIAGLRGRRVAGLRRIGKRIVVSFDGDLHLVFHLMIAGRLHWRDRGARLAGKYQLAAFDFPDGTLVLTEAGAKRRASIHVVAGEAGLAALDPGGIEVLDCDGAAFARALAAENHTLKRALTDPHVFSGIGNAYSDEILHRARLSPIAMSKKLTAAEIDRLFQATQETLRAWIERLRAETGGGFPEKVTAFRPAMAVHGRYKQPCPDCGAPVQRIVHADNETNYCPRCQTDGRMLADRALSRLLKADWPKTIEELELRRPPAAAGGQAGPPRTR
jgi:formamidopyrimidine-DNA glycosylase